MKVRPHSEYPHLFLAKYATPMTSRSVQRAFKKYVRAAGVEWAHPHTLRTTMITHRIAKGTPIADVKELVGHENIATTNAYAGLIKESQIRSVQQNAL